MYHQLFFGATCAGILMAAGLMPLPDRSRLPELSISEFSISDLSLPESAEIIAGVEGMVQDLPEMRASFQENVIRPSVQRLASALAPAEVPAPPASPEITKAAVTADISTPRSMPKPAPRPQTHQDMAKTVTFDLNAYELDAAARAQLDRFVRAVAADPGAKLGIYGHTDLPGDTAYNDMLGMARAEQVAAYLADLGIARDRIEIIKSYGEAFPTVATDAPMRENRRVNIEVL